MESGEMSVLLVVEGDIATTQLIERLLAVCGEFGTAYRKVYLESLRARDFASRTVPLFVRCGDPGLPLWLDLLKRARRPYLYYIDDNFWEIQDRGALGAYYRDPGVRAALEAAVRGADQVLTNSAVLADYLHRFTSRLRVLPPFFDFSLIEGCVRAATGELRIGFAGSPSRADDLELIGPVVQPILQRVPRAVFEFCGAMPRGVEPGERIRFFEHTNAYADFVRFQARRTWAIGLAPLLEGPANRAKTNNKYREYGGCRVAGVYSDMPPYRGSVEPGVTGLLVGPSSAAWEAAILRLALDAGERERLAARAERDVRENYSLTGVAAAWNACIRETYAGLNGGAGRLWRAYLGETALRDCGRRAAIRLLQVRDAYQKGGVRMVMAKTIERVTRRGPR